MEGAADQPEETRLDATQQILAAYGAMTTVLLDLLLEKSVVTWRSFENAWTRSCGIRQRFSLTAGAP